MQIKSVGLKIGCLFFAITSFVLFIALTFSHLLIAIVPVVVGVFVWYNTKIQRKLIRTVPTPIYQINEGWVKIQGTVSAPKTFQTPYFKQECIAYNYRKADIRYDSEDNTEREISAIVEEEFQDFYLTNPTGKIKIILNELNLKLLPPKSETKHSIKYAVDDIRYTERTLKNGDLISVLGYAKKNSDYAYELTAQAHPLVISTPDVEAETKKSFKILKLLFPYCVLMYLAVNYFLFFAPIKQHIKQNEVFIYFSIFGMPILGLILAGIGNRFSGFSKAFLTCLGGIFLVVTFLIFPLLCLLLMTKTEFYTILGVWTSVSICTSLAFVINYKKMLAYDKGL